MGACGSGLGTTGSLPVSVWSPGLLQTGWLNSKPLASHLGCYPTGTEEESPLPLRHSPPGTGVHLYLS